MNGKQRLCGRANWWWQVWVAVCVAGFCLPTDVEGADAPSGPGVASTWAPADKDFLGTSASNASRVYFTGAEGIVTEVFYPTLDKVQNIDLQFIVTDATGSWGAQHAEERRQQQVVSLIHKRAMAWHVETTANNGKWKFTKKIFTDPDRSSLIQRVEFQTMEPGKTVQDYRVYVLNNPAIENSGGGHPSPGAADNSRTLTYDGRMMVVASEPHKTSAALAVSLPWKTIDGQVKVSSGFVGRNDGWTDLFGGADDRTMDWQFDGCYGGNVAQMGWVDFGNSTQTSISFDLILAFGHNEQAAMATADATLDSTLADTENRYISEWVAYSSVLDNQNGTADDQYYLDAMKAFSSPVGFIPEQVWNQTASITGWQTTTPAPYQPGTATRSIRPLSWAMGEYINLVAAMNSGHGDAPAVVTQRYRSSEPPTTVTFNVTAQTEWGENVYLVGNSPLLSEWVPEAGIKLWPDKYPVWSVTVSLPAGSTFEYKYIQRRSQRSPVTWESGNNRVLTTPASGIVTRSESFR